MKKSKIIKICAGVLAAVLVLAIVFFALAFLFGYRFSAYATVEEVWAEDEKIEADGWTFYYYTTALIDENGEKTGEVIEGIMPVQKIGFMYRALEIKSYKTVVSDASGERVGMLASFEGDGVYHNFLFRLKSQEEISSFNIFTVDGENADVFAHSYFVTEREVSSFKIDGAEVTAE